MTARKDGNFLKPKKMKQLISIRTNSNFNLDYENTQLVPELELILIFSEPKYNVNSKNQIVKKFHVNEVRIKTCKEGLSDLISKLQVLQLNLSSFDNLSNGINQIIKANNKTQ